MFTSNMKYGLARSLFEDISYGRNAYYLTEGRLYPWPEEATPDTPLNTEGYLRSVRNDIVQALRVNANDVSLTARRVNWTSGQVYEAYDDTWTNLEEHDFFVLTPGNALYKCIDNNNGAPSTENPDNQDSMMAPLGYFTASDGYVWKFMGSLTLMERNKFLSDIRVPVKTSLISRLGSLGEIDEVRLISPGSGYTLSETTATVVGDGEGATVDFTIGANGEFETFTITDPGAGYTYAHLNIDGDGTGAAAQVLINGLVENQPVDEVELNAINGDLSRIVIEAPGTDYTNPTVEIEGDGHGAEVSVSTDAEGAITGATIENRGSGYTYMTLTLTGGGSDAVLRPILSPTGGHGSNAPVELGASGIAIFGGNMNHHEFLDDILNSPIRQNTLWKGPKDFLGRGTFSGPVGLTAFKIRLEDVSGISVEDILVFEDGKMKVVDVNEEENHIYATLLDNFNPVIFTNFSLNRAKVSIVEIIPPHIERLSGEILFVKNVDPYVKRPEEAIFHRIFINL